MLVITIIAGRESFLHEICFWIGGPDERGEQKFATLVGDHFGISPTNILLTLCVRIGGGAIKKHLDLHRDRGVL
ncbi:hypothetical protein EPB69_04265 [Geobacillus stearothermophilus]|nr:hypothetical protein EPB69_04265 [Geobacillus stearothermophilus]